jgi:hypothetical protein
MAKCSSSVARHDRRRRNSNECFGAYGWDLTMDEMKWVADWLIVRGVNLLYPHAFYYSIRDYRVDERPPDLGMHNAWWPHYRAFADYTARICRLMTDSEQVCQTAILSVDNTLPWRAAKLLYEHQIDFNYVEDWRLCEQARFEDGAIVLADMRYTTLIVDQEQPLTGEVAERVKAFEQSGGQVRYCRDKPDESLLAHVERDVMATPASPDLRHAHLRKAGIDFFLFVNEGEQEIVTDVTVRAVGRAEWFDAWRSDFTPALPRHADANTMTLPLHLERRQSLVLCVDTSAAPKTRPPTPTLSPAEGKTLSIDDWRIIDGGRSVIGKELGDWLRGPHLQQFAGTLRYEADFEIVRKKGLRYELDLGRVGDWAVVSLNGQALDVRFWAPFRWDITEVVQDGVNALVVEVTNSMAARYAPKKRRPSGLIGPVVIRKLSIPGQQ